MMSKFAVHIIVLIRFVIHLMLLFSSCEAVTTNRNFTIGGLFSIFDTRGKVDNVQAENMYAFKLAINEINSRSDILPNIHLNYVIRGGHEFSGAVTASSQLTSTIIGKQTGIAAAVGSLPDVETMASNQYFVQNKIVQAHSMASNTELGNGNKYPYKVQTCPIDSFQGMVLQHMICLTFNYSRLVIFATNDATGTAAAMESGDGAYCTLDILASYIFPSYTTDFTSMISQALDMKATIFVLHMPPVNAASLLEQGHNMGLFREGTQIFSSERATSVDTINNFSPDADVESIMKGFIGLEFWPDFGYRTQRGLSFLQKFRKQPSTMQNCHSVLDSSGYPYLAYNQSAKSLCAGLDFSNFFRNASNLSPYAGLTYDATFVIAYGLDLLIKSKKAINGDTLHDMIISNVSFQGTSGVVEIFGGMADFGYYAEGDREVGHRFKLLNFNAAAYRKNINNSFVQVGYWSKENGTQPCPVDMGCAEVVFNTKDNVPASAFPPYSHSTTPAIFKIGALFTPFDQYGKFSVSQAENLAAFLMAIDEINDKTDGIYDDILPNTQLKVALSGGFGFEGGVSAVGSLEKAFFGSGVHAIVGALPNLETEAANQMAINGKVVQVHAAAMDTDLGNGGKYPYKMQTVPIDSFQGMVIQHIFCSFLKQTKVTVFATDDIFGTKAAMESSDGTYCDIVDLSVHIFKGNAYLDDSLISSIINEAKLAGARYFFLFMDPRNAAAILEKGYNLGLFREDTQIIGSLSVTNPTTLRYMSPKANIPAIMKGYFGIQYWPTFNYREPAGRHFMQRWRKRPPTVGSLVGGVMHCNAAMDDTGTNFLYRDLIDASLCSGLNFSTYTADGGTMTSPYALHTYDAAVALAMGFHYLAISGKAVNGDNLKDVIYQNVSFQGASGLVELYEGMPDFGYYAAGDREVGHHYKLLNFNEAAYRQNINNSFVQVAYWSVENGTLPCTPDMKCQNFIFNTKDNTPPPDTPPPRYYTMSPGLQATLITIAAVAAAVAVVSFAIAFYFRSSKLIRTSQPVMLYFFLFGELLGAARVLIGGLPVSDTICGLTHWLGHLSVVLVFGSLFIKTWRVNKLINSKTLKRIRITATHVATIMSVVVVVGLLYLSVLQGIGQPHRSLIKTLVSNQTYIREKCALHVSVIETVLFVIEGLLLLFGARLCWAVKDVPDAVNESKPIAAAMTIIVAVSSLVFPVVFLLPMSPISQSVTVAFAFFVCVVSTTLLMVAPKAWILLHGGDLDKNMKVINASPIGNKYMPGLPTMDMTGDAKVGPTITADEPDTIVFAAVAMKGKSMDKKAAMCIEQIELWRAQLLKIGEDSRSRSGSGSGPRSASSAAQGSVNESVGPNGSVYEPESMIEFHAQLEGSVDHLDALPEIDGEEADEENAKCGERSPSDNPGRIHLGKAAWISPHITLTDGAAAEDGTSSIRA